MKELKKKPKKVAEFEKISYSAYYEEAGEYSRGGYYSKFAGIGSYSKSDSLEQNDDILF